jgi:hypothetical protein
LLVKVKLFFLFLKEEEKNVEREFIILNFFKNKYFDLEKNIKEKESIFLFFFF